MIKEQEFNLTQEDSKALIAANLTLTEWQIYTRLRLFENSEEKPDIEEMIQISEYSAKTFHKSLKKLKGLNLTPAWANELLLTAQKAV